MAADEPANSLFAGEILFVTLDETSNKLTFWIFDDFSGRYFNSETAEFFVCPVKPSFDLDLPLETYSIRH